MKSRQVVVPLAAWCRVMKPPAPSPLSSGSTTPIAKAQAMAAAMALPPASMISTPIAARSQPTQPP